MPDIWACLLWGLPAMQMLGEVLNLVMPELHYSADDNMKLRKSTEAGAYIVELVKGYQAFAINNEKTLLNDHI